MKFLFLTGCLIFFIWTNALHLPKNSSLLQEFTSIHDSIQFSYKTMVYNKNPYILSVELSITNITNKDIYILGTSCNKLEYCLITDTSKFDVNIFLHCNASWPIKIKLAPNKPYTFTSYLQSKKIQSLEKLGLRTTIVPEKYNLDSLVKKYHFHFPELKTDTIWGKQL